MVKADKKVEYEGADKPEKFTNFEELQKRVEVLQETIDEHAIILRSNDITKKEEIEAPYFDEEEVYNKLSKEE